jgi:hypothetical protein
MAFLKDNSIMENAKHNFKTEKMGCWGWKGWCWGSA